MEEDKLLMKTTYAGEINIAWQEVISKGIVVKKIWALKGRENAI